MSPILPRDRSDFHVALIRALPLEADFVHEVFDKFWEDEGKRYGRAPGDDNEYTHGAIGEHNVVLAYMPGTGASSAAAVAVAMRVSHPRITLALVVGVCGGMPHSTDKTEIMLGDVIISQALVQYDTGIRHPAELERRSGVQDTLGRSGSKIRSFQAQLSTDRYRQKMQANLATGLRAILQERPEASCPGPDSDILFRSTYAHQHQPSAGCRECGKGGRICKTALRSECEDLGCDPIMRQDHGNSANDSSRVPTIHFGVIGSGNALVTSAYQRDRLAKTEGIIALETEGAGVWEYLPSVLIKGVCDYADGHKRKGWQQYAAATAAACAKAFLTEWSPEEHFSLPPSTMMATEALSALRLGMKKERAVSGRKLQRTPGEL